MASKYKNITIKVSNDELNSLEDFCVVDFQGNKKKEERCRKKSLKIWGKLVSEFDKPKKKK